MKAMFVLRQKLFMYLYHSFQHSIHLKLTKYSSLVYLRHCHSSSVTDPNQLAPLLGSNRVILFSLIVPN